MTTRPGQLLKTASDSLSELQREIDIRPYGPIGTPAEEKTAGEACVALCDGNVDQARSLWKLIAADLNGYMPRAALYALMRASRTTNLVPDVEAPDPS